MGLRFWIRRFLVVFTGAFAVIAIVQWIKGASIADAAIHAAMWSFVASVVFVGARRFQSSRGDHCAICNDVPDAARVRR
jgi:hypothetical protein